MRTEVMLWLIVFAGFTINLFYMVVERSRHQTNLDRIPDRIMVNGIRGKSSTTRLIAGALRSSDAVVVAKTTGSAARFIFPDGSEEPIRRKNKVVNVIEQLGIVARAVTLGCDTLVVECMAVDPVLQELNQQRLIQSTIGVITNVRPDHLDEMGPTIQDVARSLCRSMPVGGTCVTAERVHYDILREESERRRCTLVQVDPDSVTDDEMSGFGWITFKENVAVALKVAELMGVARLVALDGMYLAQPDPGVLRVDSCVHAGKEFEAVNLFAANDPQSTVMNVDLLRSYGKIPAGMSVVINCRPDRLERNAQMGAMVGVLQPQYVFVMGVQTRSAINAIPEDYRGEVIDVGGENRTGPGLLTDIVRYIPHIGHSIVMVGNIHGHGARLMDAVTGCKVYKEPHVGRHRIDVDSETAVVSRVSFGPAPQRLAEDISTLTDMRVEAWRS